MSDSRLVLPYVFTYFSALTSGVYGKADTLDVVSLDCAGNQSFLHQCSRRAANQCSVMAGVQCMGKTASFI